MSAGAPVRDPMIEAKSQAPPSRRGVAWMRALLPLAVLFIAIMGAGALLEPASVRSASAPSQFNAKAAQQRLERVLGDEKPHPVDTAAQDQVRARLLREIETLGL